MNTPKIEVKNIKTIEISTGIAYTCTAYVNGKRAFLVENRGDGGETLFFPIVEDLYQIAKEYAESLPDVECPGFDFKAPSDLDLYIAARIDEKQPL